MRIRREERVRKVPSSSGERKCVCVCVSVCVSEEMEEEIEADKEEEEEKHRHICGKKSRVHYQGA